MLHVLSAISVILLISLIQYFTMQKFNLCKAQCVYDALGDIDIMYVKMPLDYRPHQLRQKLDFLVAENLTANWSVE